MENQNRGFQLEWINSSNPGIAQDLAIRTKIRRQAMKKAAITRRANGNYGKQNLRQFPVFEESIIEEVESGPKLLQSDAPVNPIPIMRTVDTDKGNAQPKKSKNLPANHPNRQGSLRPAFGLMTGMSSMGYESARIRFGFDIRELSSLTTVHVGRASLGTLNADTAQLVRQFVQPQSSFFTFVPSRYGKNNCLTLATDCLLSRVRLILSPESSEWKPKAISCYLKALKSLQEAIDDRSERCSPEVLCATEILALYELLDPAGQPAWMRHAAGVSRLIQLRGPASFTTEFEKSLLMAHIGPIITESLLNNERCFLEQEPWKEVFRSLISHDPMLPERFEIVIELLIHKSCIPGIFKDVTAWICECTDENTPSLRKLAGQLRELRAGLLKWHRQNEDYLNMPSESAVPEAYEKRSKIYSTYLACQIVIGRLLASVSFNRTYLEREVQILSESLLNIEADVKSVSKDANILFLSQIIGIGHASKATTQEWGEASERELERGLIERWKFELWCKLCGRKLPV